MTKRKLIPYIPKLKELARNLRNSATLAEVLLWKKLSRKQMKGYDFHRQKPINEFIVDFFCSALMLAIEIDGRSHNHKVLKDQARQAILESLGIRILRFTENECKEKHSCCFTSN